MLQQQSQKMRCVGCNSQVSFYTEAYRQISKQCAFQGSIATVFKVKSSAMVFKEKSIAMVFNETTVYDIILPSKNCQHHLEKEFQPSGISCKAINKSFLVFANFFTLNVIHTQTG